MRQQGLSVAVTGATGFIGRYICAELLRREVRVIGVVRNPGKVPALVEQGVSMRQADLADRAALESAFQGVDVVVSNAALFDLDNGNWQAHERTNIDGGRNVMEAALAAGVKRVVQVSSCAVYSAVGYGLHAEDSKQFTAQSVRHRGNRYMISKALAEQEAWKLSREQGMALTAIRPSAVYGAFDRNFTPQLRSVAAKPVSLPWVRLSMVYAGDLAVAIANCIARDETVGEAYNVAGEDLRLDDFLDAVRQVYAIPGRFRVPLPMPFRGVFNSDLAKREIGFQNRGYVQALTDTRRIEEGD